jgi:hypothetical protein
MPLVVDTTRPLRRPDELLMLVGAIVRASPNDEPDWLEWKRGMDLSQKATQGTIARAVLGMANRTVSDAARNVGGLGYVVIGAEAGSVSGVTEIDPAALGQGLQPYLGSEGPSWGMAYVRAEGKPVLVITVEPPKPGDRIRALQKETEGQKYRPGAVFVRRPGQAIQAEPGDIRALEDRFAAPLREAARDRKRERLEKISDALEAVFEAVHDAQPSDRPYVQWAVPRNRLGVLLAGWEGQKMLMIERIVNAGSAYQAKLGISAARADIDGELWRLAQEQ